MEAKAYKCPNCKMNTLIDVDTISFKAGYAERLSKANALNNEALDTMLRYGRRDIIEWIEKMSHTVYGSPSEGDYMCFSKKMWKLELTRIGYRREER